MPSTRWARTGTASVLMSSGITKSRPETSARLCAARYKRQRPARAHADVQILTPSGHVDDVEQVIGDRVIDPDLPNTLLEPQHVVGREDRS